MAEISKTIINRNQIMGHFPTLNHTIFQAVSFNVTHKYNKLKFSRTLLLTARFIEIGRFFLYHNYEKKL